MISQFSLYGRIRSKDLKFHGKMIGKISDLRSTPGSSHHDCKIKAMWKSCFYVVKFQNKWENRTKKFMFEKMMHITSSRGFFWKKNQLLGQMPKENLVQLLEYSDSLQFRSSRSNQIHYKLYLQIFSTHLCLIF